jgi:hypothetical protein
MHGSPFAGSSGENRAQARERRFPRLAIHRSPGWINRFLRETNNPKSFTRTADPDKIIAAVRRGHQQGRAYRLHLVNNSNSTHTFTSERFFHWELGSGWSWDANSRIRYRDRARRAEGSVFRRDRTGTV